MFNLHYSKHAIRRVKERTILSKEEIIVFIEKKSILIGEEKKNNRNHQLFYSSQDRMFYIIIYDNITGEIITILPEEYHENISWKISDEAKNMAMGLTLEESNDNNKKIIKPKVEKIAKERYKLKIVNYIKGKIKFMNLGTIENNYSNFNDFIKSKELSELVKSKLKEKFNKPISELYTNISIQFKKGGNYIKTIELYNLIGEGDN